MPADISVPTDAGRTYATVTWTAPTATDNIGVVDLTTTHAPGSQFDVGTTSVTYLAVDADGNQTTASFTVTVGDDEAPVIAGMPADITAPTDIGQNLATVTWTPPTATDNVGVDSLNASHQPGSQFAMGATTVTYIASDAAGNEATASFIVTVSDDEAPIITGMPADITATTDQGQTYATVTWTPPTATDNTGIANLTTSHAPGSRFPIGATTVTYAALDDAGNKPTASFVVTVNLAPPGAVTITIHDQQPGTYAFSSTESALQFSITTSGGTGSIGPVSIPAGEYAFYFTVPAGAGVSGASCTAGGTMDPSARTGSLTVVAGGAITCTINVNSSLERTAGLIGGLMDVRARVILDNVPDITRRLERLSGDYTSNGGVSAFGMSLSGSAIPFGLMLSDEGGTFSYSLRRSKTQGEQLKLSGTPQVRQPQTDKYPPAVEPIYNGLVPGMNAFGPSTNSKAGDAEVMLPASAFDSRFDGGDVDPMKNRFDLWTAGRFGKVSTGGLKGEFAILHAGLDYLLNPNLLVGLGAQLDHMTLDGAGGISVGGTGFMVGPYATAKLAPGLFIDARAAWGMSFNTVSPFGTYNDKFEADRWLATVALIGSHDFGALSVTPELRLSYFNETSETYVDTLDVTIPSFSSGTGQVDFGPTLRYQDLSGGQLSLEPFVTLKGIWTFYQESTAAAASGSPGLTGEGLRGKVEGGLDIGTFDGLSFSGSMFYDGIGDDDYKSWGGRVRVSNRF
jgi:hypothetical protein